MNTRLGLLIAVVVIGMLPSAATALDANGKWRFDVGGVTQIVPVTQTGSALSLRCSATRIPVRSHHRLAPSPITP